MRKGLLNKPKISEREKKSEDALRMCYELMAVSSQHKETWIGRYITVTAAIFSGLGAIVAFSDRAKDQLPLLIALVILSLLGCLFNYGITNHIMRLILWERAHGDRFREIEEIYKMPFVYVRELEVVYP